MSILRPGDIVTCHGRTGHFVLWDTSSRAKYTAVQHNGKYPTSHSAGPQAWTLYHRPVIEVGDFLTHNGRSAEVLSINGDFIRCGWQQRRRVEGAGDLPGAAGRVRRRAVQPGARQLTPVPEASGAVDESVVCRHVGDRHGKIQ